MHYKILIIGNNDSSTDEMATAMAKDKSSTNYGLLDGSSHAIQEYGYYHTSLVDMSSGGIVAIAHQFDEVIMLDQPGDAWSDQKLLLSTYKLMLELERQSNQLGISTTFRKNKNIKIFEEWIEYFNANKSFCVYPWVSYSFTEDAGRRTCARGEIQFNDQAVLDDIKQKMLRGKLIPANCRTCYEYERKGAEGYRIHDSLDFIAKLKLQNMDDLKSISSPYYYEIRLSNKCNLMCRMCTPNHSHLLKREFRQNPELYIEGQQENSNYRYSTINEIVIEDLSDKHQVYLTGGEPTVMREVYEFMRKCVSLNKTDFQFNIGTNAQSLSPQFLELARHFNRMHFSVSIDAYGKVNDYIRWNSNFDQIIDNCRKLKEQGHGISWNHVPTIWGVHRTHELFEFLSDEFPLEHLYLQWNRVDLHSAFKSPLIDQVLDSLERCKNTGLYYSDGKDCKTGIDAIYDHYSNYKPDNNHLKKFFAWNDSMDRARGIRMSDYIPELDSYRNNL